MIQRQIVVPTDPDRLWRALTDPEEAETWFGGRIDWTPLEEGSPLRFTPARGDGPSREGRIDAVQPGRYLRFRWWPENSPATECTDVAYVLEPDPSSESATHLTVEEAPVAVDATACASVSTPARWTLDDEMQFRVWAGSRLAVRV
ncbi:MAG TPA: SRPBCC domain-containing protein [Acidimicrobiales bacterium]|jgi:uncharacterized protein YndB with AHSA1/START domain|nr:SRPBCC domain-containing protein [Acidimicrobiales bacterium]